MTVPISENVEALADVLGLRLAELADAINAHPDGASEIAGAFRKTAKVVLALATPENAPTFLPMVDVYRAAGRVAAAVAAIQQEERGEQDGNQA